jgi:2-polyprenyl-3-methyl-5-hydroxy-6-metoxy-1,4-benzoquinol methylase
MTGNPYRQAFYARQAQWHGYEAPADALARHRQRARYYEWYTRGWLPADKGGPVLDIGCGAGQFVYFLKERGYTNVLGTDLDAGQVKLAQDLGLPCRQVDFREYLKGGGEPLALVSMLDVLEHFTREEIFEFMLLIENRLGVGGKLILSVPNADSPLGLRTLYADITHELSFTPTSLAELLFCHGLTVRAQRDPWPAPVDGVRKLYRGCVKVFRALEGLRLRLLGLSQPAIWSPVMWVLAEKADPAGPPNRG